MNTPLLSLVIPVYNVAPYLRTCLDSLLAQTRPIDEIIVVDDGSTDDCPKILDEYADRLPQMRVIRQENGGLSAARNTGIRNARGVYLAFLDSDDFVAPQMYERLLANAQADDLDIALCNAYAHFEGREPDRLIYSDVAATGVIAGSEWLRQRLQQGRLLHMVWMHLYRRDFLTRHGFSFIPRLVHEDVIWTTQVLLKAERVRYDSAPLLFYRILIRRFTPERNRNRLETIITSSIVNAKALVQLAESSASDEELKRLLRWQSVDGAFSIFHKIEKLEEADWRQARYREIHASGLFSLLWKNACDWHQRRRIARCYLKSLLSKGFRG
ncbi:glycosyltransferase [bacterium]|nr:glycosyltransferase [bacterium]